MVKCPQYPQWFWSGLYLGGLKRSLFSCCRCQILPQFWECSYNWIEPLNRLAHRRVKGSVESGGPPRPTSRHFWINLPYVWRGYQRGSHSLWLWYDPSSKKSFGDQSLRELGPRATSLHIWTNLTAVWRGSQRGLHSLWLWYDPNMKKLLGDQSQRELGPRATSLHIRVKLIQVWRWPQRALNSLWFRYDPNMKKLLGDQSQREFGPRATSLHIWGKLIHIWCEVSRGGPLDSN